MKPISKLLDVSGKSAIITGDAKGIGYDIAHRLGEAGGISKVALLLVSYMSSYITGSQIVVGGGALLA